MNAQIKITELAVNPGWFVGVLPIDGVEHVVMQIEHPRFGTMQFLIPVHEAHSMSAVLSKCADEVAEKRAVQDQPR